MLRSVGAIVFGLGKSSLVQPAPVFFASSLAVQPQCAGSVPGEASFNTLPLLCSHHFIFFCFLAADRYGRKWPWVANNLYERLLHS